MKKTYRGSCHCGAVRFEADIDLSQGGWKCNAGEAELTEYQFHTRALHHLFCKRCGVHVYGWGEAPERGRFYTPKLNCLDDVDLDELVRAPVIYVDGRHDDFKSPPAEVRHL